MAKVIVYYAHPGHRFSRANAAMWNAARQMQDITCVDLYREYPRFDINIDREQARLLDHDVIVLQFPMFWYSTPSLIKEWQDLVLEHGFAYGHGGTALSGKALQIAVTAAGSRDAYATNGYQRYDMRTFLRPLEQTAHLCNMTFPAPYVLFAALSRENNTQIEQNAIGYTVLLAQFRDAPEAPGDAPPDALTDHVSVAAREGV